MGKGNSPIMAQMEKIFRHTRANSFSTRARYESSCRKFVQFVNDQFKMKNLRNLQDKHIAAFIEHRQQVDGVAPKTLKNDLGAIRYMHDMIPKVKYELLDNKDLQQIYSLKIDKTPAINGNRAWTNQEYEGMEKLASEIITKRSKGFETARDIPDILKLCKTMGLRITEAVAMTRSQVEKAVRTGVYQVKGEAKNGKWRQVPVSEEAQKIFDSRLQETPRGGRFFVNEREKTHQAVNRFEKFIERHRKKIETKEGVELRTWERDGKTSTNELTFHGLRYNYVQDRVQGEIDKGFSLEQAAARVTQEVGHERTDVIRIYLGGNH